MKIHVLTVCRNEADRYLESALESWLTFADDVLFLDDGSTDDSRAIAESFDDVLFVEPNFDVNERSMWGGEGPYRRALFEFGWTNAEPGDILFWEDCDMSPMQDPTEFFEQEEFERFAFFLFDLWATDETHMVGQYGRERFDYRDEPPFWRAHESPRTWAIRVTDEPVEKFEWDHKRGIHAGHIPGKYFDRDRELCIVPKSHAILHFGYLDPEDQQQKHEKYMEVEDQLQGAELEHARSIADDDPRLRPLYRDVDPDLVLEKP